MKVCLECGAKFQREGWECPSCHKRPKTIEGYLTFSPELAQYSNGFKDDIFEHLAEIEDRNYWFRSRSRLIIWSLRKYFPTVENFFEIGSGTGFVLLCIEQGNVTLPLAKTVFKAMWNSRKTASTIIREQSLIPLSDEDHINEMISSILAQHRKEVERFRKGEKKIRSFFMGLIMKKTKGMFEPRLAAKLLRILLECS